MSKNGNQIGGFLDDLPCVLILELAHYYLNSDDYKSIRVMNKYLKRCLKQEAKVNSVNIKNVKQERNLRNQNLVKEDPYEIINIHNPTRGLKNFAFNKLYNDNDTQIDSKTKIIMNNFKKIKDFYDKTKREEFQTRDNLSFKTKEIMSRESEHEIKKGVTNRKKIYSVLQKFIEDVKTQNKIFLEKTIGIERTLLSLSEIDRFKTMGKAQSIILNLNPYLSTLMKMNPKLKSAFLFFILSKQHATNLESYDKRLSIMNKLQTMLRITKQRINQDIIDEKIASKPQVKHIHREYDPQMNRNRPKIMKATEKKQPQRKKTKNDNKTSNRTYFK